MCVRMSWLSARNVSKSVRDKTFDEIEIDMPSLTVKITRKILFCTHAQTELQCGGLFYILLMLVCRLIQADTKPMETECLSFFLCHCIDKYSLLL